MNTKVQTTGGYASYLNGKNLSTNKKLANITKRYYNELNSQEITLLFCLPCKQYGSPDRMIIYCVVMLLNFSGMEQ